MTDGDTRSTEGVAFAQYTVKERDDEGRDLERLEFTCFVVLIVCAAGWCLLTWADHFTCYGPSNIRSTTLHATTIRQAMTLFRAENPDAACPSMENLTEGPGPYLDSSMRIDDAWDIPFRLSCDGRDVHVVSAGPDGKFGNADDID